MISLGMNNMQLERTALGSPGQGLQKASQVQPDRTASVLQKLTGIASGVEKEYRNTQKYNIQRQAETDIINQTVNPDLEASSAIYSGKVIEYQQAERFNKLKTDIQSGAYDDMSPKDFQKLLTDEHKKNTELFGSTEYSDLNQEIYSKFWAKNEGTLVAAQRGMATAKTKQKQETLYLQNVKVMFPAGLQEDAVRSTVDNLYKNAAGDLVSRDYKIKALATAAGLSAMQGDSTLLDVLDDKFNISLREDTKNIYKAGKVAYAKATTSIDKQAQFDLLSEIGKNTEAGTLTEEMAKAYLDNPNFKQTPTWLYNKVSESAKIRVQKEAVDQYISCIMNGRVPNTVLSKKEKDAADSNILSTLTEQTKDPEVLGTAIAAMWGKADYPDALSTELNVFSSDTLYTDESRTEINPHIKDTYYMLRGMEKSPNSNPSVFNKVFKNNPDAVRLYEDMKLYMDSSIGSEDQRFKKAISKIKQLQETAGKVSPSLVKVKTDEAVSLLDSRISDDNSWLFWKNTKSEVMRNTYKSIVLDLAKNEIRMGRDSETALNIAEKLVNNKFSTQFGQLQDTGGVSIAHRNGFATSEELDDFFDYVTVSDPEIKASLMQVFGEDYDLKDHSIYYDKDHNTLSIGGETGEAFIISMETIKAKYDLHMQEEAEKAIKKKEEAAEKIKEKLRAQEIAANNEFAHKLIQGEEGTLTNSVYADDRRYASNKFKKAISELPGVYKNITSDKFMALSPKEQTAARYVINKKLSTIGEIPGFSDNIFEKAWKFLKGKKKDIIPYKGLLEKANAYNNKVNKEVEESIKKIGKAVSNFFVPEAGASVLTPTEMGQIYDLNTQELETVLTPDEAKKFVEIQNKVSGYSIEDDVGLQRLPEEEQKLFNLLKNKLNFKYNKRTLKSTQDYLEAIELSKNGNQYPTEVIRKVMTNVKEDDPKLQSLPASFDTNLPATLNTAEKDIMKQVALEENDKRIGFNTKEGKWYPHTSKEKNKNGTNLKTIGYGHLCTSKTEQEKLEEEGWTEEQAQKQFIKDWNDAKAKVKNKYPDLDDFPEKYQLLLIAMTFNIGKVPTKGKKSKTTTPYPSMLAAMKSEDDYRVRRESITTFKKGSKTKYLASRAARIAETLGITWEN